MPPPPSIVDIRQQDEVKPPVKMEEGGEPVPQAPTAVYQQHVSPPANLPGVAGAAPPVASTPTTAQGGGFRQVKFENALDFLDEVKLVFANQPEVYNSFLDIMKEFKTKHIDTPGVIMRVKELFKGRPALVLGFNNFLPPGYKITLPPSEGGEEPSAAPAAVAPAALQPAQTKAHLQAPAAAVVAPAQTAAAAAPAAAPAVGADGKQPEFDHARNFVKKIKTRFALHPAIYVSLFLIGFVLFSDSDIFRLQKVCANLVHHSKVV